MINLTQSTHQLQVVLDAIPSGSPPNECHCFISYRQTTDVSYEFGNSFDYTDGVNEVPLAEGSSISGTIKVIDHVSIYNPDSASVIVTVKFYDGSGGLPYILVKQTLGQNETLIYNDKQGWQII